MADGTPVAGLGGAQTAGRCLVMGILNVTPDSFSDGGRWSSTEQAVAGGHALASAGADLVDVGGESTRPGAARVPADVELGRVLPVVRALAGDGLACSVDTTRADVASACVEAGAVMVNDVSGGLADDAMLGRVAGLGVAYAAMHWRAASTEMDRHTHYVDGVVAGVVAELGARRDAALAAGVAADRLVLDPGLGFAKTGAQNWELLAGLPHLLALGHPLLLGASRKRFLGSLLADDAGEPRPVDDREAAGVALTALAAAGGAWGVRVHQVGPHRDAVSAAAAWGAGGHA